MYDDKELNEYRDLLKAPDHFEDGFNWKTIAGAVFIGFLMMPGSMYLQLVIGTGIGPAARWVTIILFAESAHDKPYLHFSLMGAIGVMTGIIYLTFYYSPKIVKFLGATGLDVLTKIFGLITLALGIQFILTGISDAFPKIM